MSEYANPERLVSTDWVDKKRGDLGGVRIVESNEDVMLYDTGHIPGAVKVDWHNDLQHPVLRDYITPEMFAELCSRLGIGPDTTVVFYGDKSNWWAAYALWVFTMFGHDKCVLMNGGRKKWQDEGRPMTTDKPDLPAKDYPTPAIDFSNRAFRDDVLRYSRERGPLIDVRSPGEFSGELTHMPDYPQEGAQRGGHVPGAANVPWARAANEDGTFKSREELEKIYLGEAGLQPGDDVIAYCRIGERSSHTWFVLKHLLGFPRVRNYDGSWTEWGNLVGMPIETGPGKKT
ncbi:MAG: sulfurtransferase [Phycisphaerales bacterium]|nr:sulfurtransferase [Phycisphaerales bacterium]